MVRYKNRYFVVELEVKDRPPHAPLAVNQYELRKSIFRKISQIHGDFGVAAITSGFRIKYCNPYTKIVLIKSRHGPHRLIGTVLPLIKTVEECQVQFNVLHIGGTMIKCFKFIRNHQLSTLEKYWNKMKTEEDRIHMKEAIMKLNLLPKDI